MWLGSLLTEIHFHLITFLKNALIGDFDLIQVTINIVARSLLFPLLAYLSSLVVNNHASFL